jgi:hypothetical protein
MIIADCWFARLGGVVAETKVGERELTLVGKGSGHAHQTATDADRYESADLEKPVPMVPAVAVANQSRS